MGTWESTHLAFPGQEDWTGPWRPPGACSALNGYVPGLEAQSAHLRLGFLSRRGHLPTL